MSIDLFELAKRVEAASGPDRKLDAEIAVALKIGARGLLDDDHEYLTTVRADDSCASGTYWFNCRSGKSLRTAPEFTGSVDAALTLKDVEWLIDIEQLFDLGWEVELWVLYANDADMAQALGSNTRGPSLPQVIAASALKVRASLAARPERKDLPHDSPAGPLLTAMLGKLNEAEVLWLLGEIVDPSILCPFDLDSMDEQFLNAMYPIATAYQGAFSQLERFASAAVDGDER